MQTSGVYVIIETKTKCFYIGSSLDMRKRIDRHYRELLNKKHHNVLLQELANSGSYFREIFFPVENREQAYLLEQSLMDMHIDNPLLLNIGLSTKGGDNLSRNPNRISIIEKIKNSIKDTLCGLTPDEKRILWGKLGELNPMYGKKHTEQSLLKMSLASKGNKYALGSIRSVEARKKLSELASARTGNKNPFFGKCHTDRKSVV